MEDAGNGDVQVLGPQTAAVRPEGELRPGIDREADLEVTRRVFSSFAFAPIFSPAPPAGPPTTLSAAPSTSATAQDVAFFLTFFFLLWMRDSVFRGSPRLSPTAREIQITSLERASERERAAPGTLSRRDAFEEDDASAPAPLLCRSKRETSSILCCFSPHAHVADLSSFFLQNKNAQNQKKKRYWLEVAGVDVVARTPNTPTAARLSYGGGNDSPTVQVTWHTRDTVAGSKVSYGTSPQALTFSVTPTTDTSYYQSIFCAAPARFQPAEAEVVPLLQTTSEGGAFLTGTINNAVLTGLLPDTTYFFEVTVPGEAETRTGSFNTAPATLASASPAAVTRMLLVADGGQARVDGKRIADLSSFFFFR